MAPPETLDRQYKAIVAENERIVSLTKKGIARDYAAMLKDLKRIVADAYEEYARTGSLSFEEMQRFNRIKVLKSELDRATFKGTEPLYAQMSGGLEKVIVHSYDGSIAAISAVANSNIGRELTATEIQDILNKPVSGWTLEERIGLRRTDLGNRIQQSVTQGFIREASYEDQARSLKQLIVKDLARTDRTMEDLGHQVQNDTFVKSFKDVSEENIEVVKVWVSAGDDLVRDSHAALDGQEVSADDMFTIPSGYPNSGAQADGPGLFGIPEEDINCRCWLVAGVRKKE